MRKIEKILNIQKANQLNEQLHKELKENEEPKVLGHEGKAKRIAELIQQRDMLKAEHVKISKKIKELNDEIKRWEIEISVNQTSLF